MRGRKPTKKLTQSNLSAKNIKQDKHQKLQAQLQKAMQSRKDLEKKLAAANAEWKVKIKQIEEEAFENARLAFEKEFFKKEEARQKVITAALAKFEKQYAKKPGKRSTKTSKKSSPAKSTKSAKKKATS